MEYRTCRGGKAFTVTWRHRAFLCSLEITKFVDYSLLSPTTQRGLRPHCPPPTTTMPVAYSAASNNARRTSQPSTSTTSPNATSPASPSPSSSAAAIANTVASPASASAAVTPPRTKILLVGLRRSGKSSIREVLFADMPPKETFYLEPTMRTRKTVYE